MRDRKGGEGGGGGRNEMRVRQVADGRQRHHNAGMTCNHHRATQSLA
jgi:hypothetical protein